MTIIQIITILFLILCIASSCVGIYYSRTTIKALEEINNQEDNQHD